MKNIFSKLKKKPLIFLLALLFVGIIGGTVALFTNYVIYSNKFDTSKYNVVIKEEFNNEFGTKKVNLVNEGSNDVIIRINYNEYWSKIIEENKVYLNTMIDGTNLVDKSWTEEFLKNFTYHDGWYYYNKLLKGNSSIQILTEINLSEAIDESIYDSEYANADYDLDFNLETVQATESAIKKIWGFDVSINGDDLLWEF